MTDSQNSISLFLPSEAATQQLGEDLALALKPGDCVALWGDLGAGKSTLCRALLRAMADDSELEVPSPTFTLVQNYDLRLPVAHFDLYRLSDPGELDELGFEDALKDGACLVEWPEKVGALLPRPDWDIQLQPVDDSARQARIEAHSARGMHLLQSLELQT